MYARRMQVGGRQQLCKYRMDEGEGRFVVVDECAVY